MNFYRKKKWENYTSVIKTGVKGHFCPVLKKKVTSVRKKTVLSPIIWIVFETLKRTLLSPKRHFRHFFKIFNVVGFENKQNYSTVRKIKQCTKKSILIYEIGAHVTDWCEPSTKPQGTVSWIQLRECTHLFFTCKRFSEVVFCDTRSIVFWTSMLRTTWN